MTAGRPRQVHPGALYAFAHQLYWDFKRLADHGAWLHSNSHWLAGEFPKTKSMTNKRSKEKIPDDDDIDVLEMLLAAKTCEDIRRLCRTNGTWPVSSGSVLAAHLYDYAECFIDARKDPRFPRCSSRPSNELKQLWFLSRALAGAAFKIKTRTAINLVGSMRPEQIFEESRGAKPKRAGKAKARS